MQRRVRQHQAKLPVARRDRAGHGAGADAAGQPGQQHDRPPGAGQQRLGRLIHLAQLAGGGDVRHHDRERLVLPVLAFPQRRRRALAARVHRQVIAAHALDGEHLSAPQQASRRRQRLPGQQRSGRGQQPQPGPAGRAADRLRVKPAVGGILVFRRAARAHGEARHRGQRPVVGHVPDNREPRPAVGAVDERVAEPAVGRIGEFPQAVIAGGGIGRDQGGALPGRVALGDGEPRRSVRPEGLRADPLDPGQRRRILLE